MFDFSQVLELLRVEPGHGLVQSILLTMIWWTSRGMRKDLADVKAEHSIRFAKLEGRVTILETNKEK